MFSRECGARMLIWDHSLGSLRYAGCRLVSLAARRVFTEMQPLRIWAPLLGLFETRQLRRDFGPRQDRQKARLMWLVEAMGVDAFREKVGEYMGVKLRTAVHEKVSQPPDCRLHSWCRALSRCLGHLAASHERVEVTEHLHAQVGCRA